MSITIFRIANGELNITGWGIFFLVMFAAMVSSSVTVRR